MGREAQRRVTVADSGCEGDGESEAAGGEVAAGVVGYGGWGGGGGGVLACSASPKGREEEPRGTVEKTIKRRGEKKKKHIKLY